MEALGESMEVPQGFQGAPDARWLFGSQETCPCIQAFPAVPQEVCNMGDPLYSLGIAGGF